MSLTNQDLCHQFFYSDKASYMPNYKSVGFSGNLFYSYYTTIGQIEEDKDGRRVLLLSYYNMSVSTARHISYLRSASPLHVLYVPFFYGEHGQINIKTLAERCIEKLDIYAKSKLSQKANREEFFSFYNMLNELNEYFITGVKMPKKHIDLFKILNDSEQVKKIKIKQAEIERKAEARAKRTLNKLLKNNNICELAKMAYSYSPNKDADLIARIKNAINPRNDLSFVWRDDEGNFKTSQHVTVKKEDGEKALNLWKRGKLKHGMKIDYYEVILVTDDFVKIGCHKIPVDNLRLL